MADQYDRMQDEADEWNSEDLEAEAERIANLPTDQRKVWITYILLLRDCDSEADRRFAEDFIRTRMKR